jgi:hypothetical protein
VGAVYGRGWFSRKRIEQIEESHRLIRASKINAVYAFCVRCASCVLTSLIVEGDVVDEACPERIGCGEGSSVDHGTDRVSRQLSSRRDLSHERSVEVVEELVDGASDLLWHVVARERIRRALEATELQEVGAQPEIGEKCARVKYVGCQSDKVKRAGGRDADAVA